MKKILSVIIAFVFLLSSGNIDLLRAYEAGNAAGGVKISGYNSGPLTLSDCYSLSLIQSEIIAIDEAKIRETEAIFLQALSIMAPHASFLSSDNQEAQPNDAGTTFATLKPARSSVRNFNVTQTLFSGFKAFAAMKASKLQKDQRLREKERAEQLLLVDVANTFYLVIEKKQDLMALNRIRSALDKRIEELRQRERLGRSRPSEVVNAKTQLYNVEADMELSRNQEVIARQILEFLIGKPVSSLKDDFKMPESLDSKEYYMSRSDLRPDVNAAKYAWMVSRKQREIIDSDFLPKVDVAANYYTQRTGFNKDTDWDVVLKVKVPIFEGTEVLGKSKQAELVAKENELEYRRLKRKAPYDIKEAYIKLETAMNVAEALQKAYKMAKLNYRLQRKDYEFSLVNNLDVLASIQTLQNSERDYIHAYYEAKRLYWQLRVAAGESINGEFE